MKRSLEDIYADFREDLKKITDEAIGEMVTNYVPYAETDYDMNVMLRAADLLRSFIAGEQMPDWLPESHLFRNYSGRKVREKILEDFRDELIEDLNQDHLQQIESLKSYIEHLERRF